MLSIKERVVSLPKTDYEKFKDIIEDAQKLHDVDAMASSPAVNSWKAHAERFLSHKYGQDSIELSQFKKIRFSPQITTSFTTPQDLIKSCKKGLREFILTFSSYLEELQDETIEMLPFQKQIIDYSKIFIVHGHDNETKEAVAHLIKSQGITPIILNEQVNCGATIIEKIEKYSDVASAICLFTADDAGKANDSNKLQNRARQNVVFETGYFIAKLGRKNVIIIADSSVEIPSDLHGVCFYDKSNWETEILYELRALGFSIDMKPEL